MIVEFVKERVFEEKKTLLAMLQLGPYYWVRLVIPVAKSIVLKSYLVRYCFFYETFRLTYSGAFFQINNL